jgi:hypothetical protein
MMETDVSCGLGNSDNDATVGYSFPSTSIAFAPGLMGVTGKPRIAYHRKTSLDVSSYKTLQCMSNARKYEVDWSLPLYPNFSVFVLAPTTANLAD